VTHKYFFFWVSASIQVDKNKNKLATLKRAPSLRTAVGSHLIPILKCFFFL
jgi:hypothetical protein